MHITKRLFLAAAMAAGFVGSAYARTITVTENKEGGETTSFNLAFSTDTEDHSLWMVYGKANGGESFSGWANVKYIGEVAGSDTSLADSVPVPAGWGTTVYRVRFILASGGDVPGGQLLDYIQADGVDQHVLTEFTPTGNSAVEVDFQFNSKNSCALFCARNSLSPTAKAFFLHWNNSNKNWAWYYNDTMLTAPASERAPETSRHTIRADWSGVNIDGNLISNTASDQPADFTAGSALRIFASWGGGWGIGNKVNGKLYSFKAWTNGADTATIALDLVPCKKNDGTVCLYDKANERFLVNSGSGNFTPGSVVLSGTTEPVAASDVVTVSLPGWIASNGTYFPYVYPLYVADVSSSNSIDEVTFQKFEEGQTTPSENVSYADFVASAPTGTIIKCGGGTLTFNQDISTFTGPVHVEDGVAIGVCAKCFGSATYSGRGTDNQRIYVHSGATLVMDAVGNEPAKAEYNAVYYEGDGHPGMGGAYVFRNGETSDGVSFWQSGVRSKAVGPTRIFIDLPSGGVTRITWDPHAEFSLGGQDVLMYGRTVGSWYGANSDPILDIGNLVVSNMTMEVGGSNGELRAKNGSASTIRFLGGSRWIWNSTSDQTGQTATTFIDDLEYAQIGRYNSNGFGIDPWGADGDTKRNWYYGPMVLNDDFRLRNYSVNYRSGCTFAAKVGGNGGFRPYQNYGRNTRINLLNDNNDFKGGIVLSEGALGVYGAKAVPSHEGAGLVSITNGYVYFGRTLESAAVTNAWVDFTMPVTEFSGNCAVTNGTGLFKGLVKKGTGTLDYNSQMGGDYLDLQGGTVAFKTQYRDAYTGDNASAAPSGYAAALPVFTTLKGTAGALDLAGVGGGTYTVANVEGSPCVTNGNLSVTGAWAVDASSIGNPVRVSGTLTFGESATVTLADGFESERSVLLAKAAAIDGMPQLVGGNDWQLVVADGELRLASNKPTVISFR